MNTDERRWERIVRLGFLLLVMQTALAQSPSFDSLDIFLTQVATRIPSGFEVMIVQDGRQVYWKEFGVWRKNEQARTASATKWLSGAVIMSLVDDGTLSLDDRASRYLPYMTGEKEAITIRQLMSHTSGFGGEFPLVEPCLGDSSDTLEQCAEKIARTPLQGPAGTAFIYSGAGMQVAGRAAEVASGKDWQTLFRERIAGPLGMNSTDYEYEGPTRNPRISGGGRSTATDYMKFLTMLHQRGMYEGRRILSSRAVDVMLSNQVGGARIVDTPAAENWLYGIGNWLEQPDSNGKTFQNSSTGLAGWTPMLDRSRNLQVVIGMQNAIRPFQPHYPEFRQILQQTFPVATLTPIGITNSASYEAGPIAPGEVVTLFGSNLGTSSGVSGQFVNGVLPSTLQGTQVTFDGVAAPLLYVSSGQVLVVAPVEVAGRSDVTVQVSYNGAKSSAVRIPVATAWPALFSADASGRGQAAALNQDGRTNSASNPAMRGTIVQLFGTGGGLTDPPVQSGILQTSAGRLVENVRVTIGGMPAEVSYAGPAPGQLSGTFQVNAKVPENTIAGGAVPVMVQVGTTASLPVVTIAVQ